MRERTGPFEHQPTTFKGAHRRQAGPRVKGALALAAILLVPVPVRAETGADAWIRYRGGGERLLVLGDSPLIRSARTELARFGFAPTRDAAVSDVPVVLGTRDRVLRVIPGAAIPALTKAGSFWLGRAPVGRRAVNVVAGYDDRGVLYGTFALLRRLEAQDDLPRVSIREEPAAAYRWTNEWNNLDGSIERGYAGPSIFFENGRVAADLTRAAEYARILASVGINGAAVNNVNADPRVLTPEFVPQLARIADVFRPWGVALAIAIDFSSPQKIGGLETFDPLDGRVAAFWKDRVDALYRAIPDFAGFVLKADSEGRLGPSAYGRTHADAANVIARALAPHTGVLFYRGFVYDHLMDWRNPRNDRAKAAVDNFLPLDGQFDANVILQIKNGPIDFQVREPVSPLFTALTRTKRALELQITQEYLGQQRHVVFLPSMWKETVDAARPLVGGYVGVSNVGRAPNWLGHDLAMANLYGFGRLAWNPDLTPEQIAREWVTTTFGNNARVVSTMTGILLDSWRTYERYTGNLGIGTLTDIIRAHYGPGVESSERNGWGQWHRADGAGVGMDRTVATGTGFTAQYPAAMAAAYESLETTPDDLLLFFHHVPYTHVLKNGKTIIQHIYDEHYLGAEEAASFVGRWRALDGAIDRGRYAAVLAKLEYQAGHAIVWRDAVTNWFRRTSGIDDVRGRVGRYPNRVEAESLQLDRFVVDDVTPWETASGGKAIRCPARATCAATLRADRPAGTYDIVVQYFDENDGASSFTLKVGDRRIDRWIADDEFPSSVPNGHTSTRRVIRRVSLKPGDVIRLEATPDRDEGAVIDYVEIVTPTPTPTPTP